MTSKGNQNGQDGYLLSDLPQSRTYYQLMCDAYVLPRLSFPYPTYADTIKYIDNI